MTPVQKIKWAILKKTTELDGKQRVEATAENIDELYDELIEEDAYWDAKAEVRGGDFETKLPCPISRHYECTAVAAKMPDGSYVGWNYWYGGGKHGEPESIDWMSEAYPVNCAEEEKLVIVRTFTKADATGA